VDTKTILASAVIAAVLSGIVALIGSMVTAAAAERRLRRELGGFEDDELRRILVRIGAVRFTGDGKEGRWVIWKRNANYVNRITTDIRPKPIRVSSSQLCKG
jgi:hypothetical protein